MERRDGVKSLRGDRRKKALGAPIRSDSTSHPKRLACIMIACLFLFVAFGTGCAPESTDEAQAPPRESSEEETPVADEVAPESVEEDRSEVETADLPGRRVFDGAGDYLTDPFALPAGILQMGAIHEGNSNFVITFVSETGEWDELSINEIGAYSGVRGHLVASDAIMGLAPGEHRLEVKADGSWEIWLEYWDGAEASMPPTAAEGSGDGVFAVELPEGTTPMQLTHEGDGNFIVELLALRGTARELAVNEIGNYDGSVALRARLGAIMGLEPGPHLVVVRADGPWDIRLDE